MHDEELVKDWKKHIMIELNSKELSSFAFQELQKALKTFNINLREHDVSKGTTEWILKFTKGEKNMDTFFNQKRCDRCGKEFNRTGRTMSWFTKECICMECSNKEQVIKETLRKQGKGDMEGCGYVPTI